MASKSGPVEIELGKVLLGSGEGRLVYWPVGGPHDHPSLMLFDQKGGGGGECSEHLKWVFGGNFMGIGEGSDAGTFQVHGEVAPGYGRVSLICGDGTQADTAVLDCVEHIGFNVYVAEVRSFPLRVVASDDLGHTVSKLTCQPSFWTHMTPEEAALDGWPKTSPVRVAAVDIRGDRAEVVLDTDPSWPNWVHCVRTRGRWHEAITTNGPTSEWDDLWPDPMSPSPR
jgi:hypothetical protein